MKSIQLGAFLAGSMCIGACANAPEILAPPCDSPVMLDGKYHHRTTGYLISVRHNVMNVESLVHNLAAKHAFKPSSIMSTVRIFSVETISPEALAALRCEPAIRGISFDEPTTIGHMRSNKRFESARTARPTHKSDALLLAAQPRRYVAIREEIRSVAESPEP
jgi:hypothetical protein